jgi:peptide subunit release factor 1 (eRF1)
METRMLTAETIDRITRFDGHGLPVVSVYMEVPVDVRDRAALAGRAESLLQQLGPLAESEELERDAKLSVRSDIDRIGTAVKSERFDAGGVAFFSCSGADLFEEVPLPRAVHDRVMVDTTPWVRPMLAVLDEYHRAGIVILDSRTASVWELYQDELVEERRVKDRNLRTSRAAGGWQGYQEIVVHHRAQELTKRHFRHVANMLADLDRGQRYDLLIVGGHVGEIQGFLDQLPNNLREKVAGTFEVDPNTVDRGVLKEQAGRILAEFEQELERHDVADVFTRAAERRPAAIGLRDTLWAGSVSAIHRLLIRGDTTVPGVACDNCGYLATAGETCPVCASTLRHTPDVVDELVQAVVDESGSVEHVESEGTELDQHLVAASLRFPLPPLPNGNVRQR